MKKKRVANMEDDNLWGKLLSNPNNNSSLIYYHINQHNSRIKHSLNVTSRPTYMAKS